jgi:hypothetical protein
MTRARDVASILTAASVLGTDVETATAISNHATAANGHTTRGDTASKPASPTLGDLYSNTQTGYIEVYTAEGWSQLGVIPTSPTIGTATNVGTNRAYNDGAVSVTFSPGAGGGLVSSFTSTSVSGGYSGSGASSPVLVTGIPTGTSATFTAVATNGYGNSLASAASNSVTVTTVPQAPVLGTVTKVSSTEVSIPFTVNSGGSTVTSYNIVSSPAIELTYSGTSSPMAVSGSFVEGQSYTFTVRATNANGNSLYSSSSNSITPFLRVAVDYLVVAAGGGGGSPYGGGGGAGGYLTGSLSIDAALSYAITVGGGGDSPTYGAGGSGTNSVFSSITSIGGGGGGSVNSNQGGRIGGSGGGRAGNTAGSGAAGTSGQGNSGGSVASTGVLGGGGGGGATSTGSAATGGGFGAASGGAGGNGTASSITGTSVTYAGGGGGGGNTSGLGGAGGSGGGGNGSRGSNNSPNGSAGTDNLGGGGGGGYDAGPGYGGGSGVVIIRALQAAASTTGSPVYSTSGSYHIYKFNSSGSITY